MLSLRRAYTDCLGVDPSLGGRSLLFHLPVDYSGELSFRDQLEYVSAKGVLPHPFLSRLTTNMHEDSSATDVVTDAGPGIGSRLIGQDYLDYFNPSGPGKMGMLPTLGFTSDERIMAIGAKAGLSYSWRFSRNIGRWFSNLIFGRGIPLEIRATGSKDFSVLLMNSETVEIEQEVQLPISPLEPKSINITVPFNLSIPISSDIFVTIHDFFQSVWGFDEHKLYEDTSGGAYFMLDNKDRAITPTSEKAIWIIWFPEGEDPQQITIEIPDLSSDDALVAVGPVWQYEDHYWFATRQGVIGVASIEAGVINRYEMRTAVDGESTETINNSFAIGSDGLFVVSSHALYRFNFPPDMDDGIYRWRAEYMRGTEVKCGQLPPAGSGTTPTLIGQRFVAICDNAINMNVHVFDRESGVTTALERVFPTPDVGGETPEGASACDNSIVAYKFTLFIGNTHCYRDPFSSNPTGGLTRFDIDPLSGSINRIWTNLDITIWSAVPKYSSVTDLLYIYAREEIGGVNWWHIKGIDRDGNVRISIPVHEEEQVSGIDINLGRINLRDIIVDRYDNGWGPLYIRNDATGGSSIMIGMTQGLYRVGFSE